MRRWYFCAGVYMWKAVYIGVYMQVVYICWGVYAGCLCWGVYAGDKICWGVCAGCILLGCMRRWYMALMQHRRFAAAFSAAPSSIFCPSAGDPPSVKEQLLQALLLHCSSNSSSSSSGSSGGRRGPPCNLFDVCGVMYEFTSIKRAPEVHAVVFRFLLRTFLQPQLSSPQLHTFLCEHLR